MENLTSIAKTVRQDIVRMIASAGSGHPGGSLSGVEIAVALYFDIMNIDPKDVTKPDRDKFVLSKGHAAPLLYAVLGNRGYFDKAEFNNLRKFGAMLQGHPDMELVPGVEISTGSLGQGISAAVGMALAQKLDKSPARTFVLVGDGELEEGIVWEALMSAAHHKLDNFIVFVDYNGLQIDGRTEDVMNVGNIGAKFAAFDFDVIEVEDGNDLASVLAAARKACENKDGPTAVVCKTIKGKGVSFMEDKAGWHGKAPKEAETAQALAELEGR